MSSFFGGGGGSSSASDAARQQAAEEERKKAYRERNSANFGTYEGSDPTLMSTSAAAKQQLADEEASLSKSYRDYYTDQQKKWYDNSLRALRFGSARQGMTSGSEYADELADLEQQNQLGSTKIQDAVNSALANLRSSREDVKNRTASLINSGSGEDAVAAASSGLRAAIENASSAAKAQIFPDVANNLALAKVLGNQNAGDAATMAMWKNRASSWFPTSGSSGTVIQTPS